MAGNRLRLSPDEAELIQLMRTEGIAPNAVRGSLDTIITEQGGDIPVLLPESFAEDVKPVDIYGSRVGWISDVHVPVHDMVALTTAMQHLRRRNIDALVLGGDIADMYALTRHGRDSRTYGISTELRRINEFLDAVRATFGTIPIWYIEGNHENWWKRYMRSVAREMDDEWQPYEEKVRLRERGITWCDNGVGLKLGKLRLIHGHEIAGAGIYVAKRKLERAKTNIIFGHHHQEQSWTDTNIAGEQIGSWAVGCLCQRGPEWARFTAWSHGFAFIEVDHDGSFEVSNHRIINGRVK